MIATLSRYETPRCKNGRCFCRQSGGCGAHHRNMIAKPPVPHAPPPVPLN